jgi:hypothetical protein
MRLHSAFEDLTTTTLEAVAGLLGKLNYLSSLRGSGSSYTHWGLAKVYGDSAAQEALEQAHKGIFSKVLRTPLPDLLEDLKECSKAAGLTPTDYLKSLSDSKESLVPFNLSSGSVKHFSSVLGALSNLQKSRRAILPVS